MDVYEVRPRADRRGFDLLSEQLPFGRLWYGDARRSQQFVGAFVELERQVLTVTFYLESIQ